MKGKYDYAKILGMYEEARTERVDFEAEWRNISNFLLPGRGVYQTYTKPRKRQLTTTNVINTVAEDALYVLTSGMHSGLTSPSRPWFRLAWSDEKIKTVEPLVAWLQDSENRLNAGLHASNFYSIINSFYIEYVGFGNGCVYVGEDSDTVQAPFRFELLTAGEYAFTLGSDGRPSTFFRTVFMSQRQLVERFRTQVSAEIRKKVEANEAGIDVIDLAVVEIVMHDAFMDKPWTRVYYEASSESAAGNSSEKEPLEVSGYYEFPYPLARWSTIGSDTYGIGPGSRALPDIKRLQEMEKAFLMATHKAINPPLNAPARMRGKLNTLPGGYNYYSNPQETVNEIYQVRFDYTGVGGAIERVEQRIQRNFFNDIFLTAARDPNATPYKATEVNAREQEKMLRLGPVIERLQHEFLQPVIERCFNIMLRKELFAPLDPALAEMAGEYTISLVSPLATAQRAVALNGIQTFMGFIGQAAQFDQSILDNIDTDEAAREMADIAGVQLGVLRKKEDIQKMRQQRAQAAAKEKAKQEQAALMQMQSQMNTEKATAQKAQSEAGLNMLEGQQLQTDMGLI